MADRGPDADGAGEKEPTKRANSVEKLFAASANFQKTEEYSAIIAICQKKPAKLERTRMLFLQIWPKCPILEFFNRISPKQTVIAWLWACDCPIVSVCGSFSQHSVGRVPPYVPLHALRFAQ